jgi:aminoglycoside phosphotransferase (APT) family kinase protein
VDAPDPALVEFVCDVVASVVGADAITQVDALQVGPGEAVLLLGPARTRRRVVMKVVQRGSRPHVDFERTAAAMSLARGAGVPVAQTLAVDDSYRRGPWQYLLHTYVEGLPWRLLRPQLNAGEIESAHEQLAEVILALHSVRLHSFGELSRSGEPTGSDLPTSLRRRAAMRIPNPNHRALFNEVLDRNIGLFPGSTAPTLCHDDVHHGNVIFEISDNGPRLVGIIDWDKAWAGPAESDIAHMSFWDDMTGLGFWRAYRSDTPRDQAATRRTLIYQLLWCLEYNQETPRHLADTRHLCRALGMRFPA